MLSFVILINKINQICCSAAIITGLSTISKNIGTLIETMMKNVESERRICQLVVAYSAMNCQIFGHNHVID